jgi:hypothetical protein
MRASTIRNPPFPNRCPGWWMRTPRGLRGVGWPFRERYHLTLQHLPPQESRARAAGMLYENRPTRVWTGAVGLTPSWQRPIACSTCSMA